MKKVLSIMIVFMVLMVMKCNVVYAEPKIQEANIKVSQITVQANIPSKFDRKIYVNFKLEDGTSASYTLDSTNKYKIDGDIKVGNAKLNFVKIVGNDDNQYSYRCDENILIKESEKANFTININKNEKINSSEKDNKNISDENIKESNESKVQEQVKNNKDSNNVKTEKQPIGEKIDTFFKTTSITLLIVAIMGVIYVVFKIKKRL